MTFSRRRARCSLGLTAIIVVTAARADLSADQADAVFAPSAVIATSQPLPLVDLLGGDEAGRAVDIAGELAIVGVPKKFTSAGDVGTAYVFQLEGTSWIPMQRLDPGGLRDGDNYGKSVAIDGDTAAVGAYNRTSGAGTVYIWSQIGGTWTLVDILLAPGASAIEWFGWSLDLDDNLLAVGAPLREGGATDSGAVFIFEHTQADWVHTGTIHSSSPVADLQLGYQVALDRETLVVGSGPSVDRVEVYRLDGIEWSLDGLIQAPGDAGFESQFGAAVGIDGDTVVVGAPRYDAIADDGSPRADAGAAYVYDRDTIGWQLTALLVAQDSEAGDDLGRAVDIAGGIVVAGSQRYDLPIDGGFSLNEAGGVFVFIRDGTGWGEAGVLGAADAGIGDNFGFAVALDRDHIVAGAPKAEYDVSAFDLGKAYVFATPGSSGTCAVRTFSTEELRVSEAYIAYYGRAPDLAGSQFWTQELAEAGGNLESIIQAFGESEEFSRRFGNLDNFALVSNIYLQVLGRNPDPAGFEFYLGQLEAGTMTLQTIALNVIDGVTGDDVAVVDNRLLVAGHYLIRQKQLGDAAIPVSDTVLAEILAGVGADAGQVDDACGALDTLMGAP